jgi:hypothetical protein
MIYDGRNGYVKGTLNQPVDTVLAIIKGPVLNKNWYSGNDPTYSITITSGASGAVALEGTNDVAYQSNGADPVTVSADFLPANGATWTAIHASTSTSVSGTVSAGYEFIRLIIKTQGTGIVTQAWVRWN